MASSFEVELLAFEKDLIETRLTTYHKRICEFLYHGFRTKTPVDTYNAFKVWNVTIGQPSEIEVEQTEQDALAVIKSIKPFDTVYIANNADYILILEEGGFVPADPGPSSDPRPSRKGKILVQGGFSTQAPQGMVAITIEELRNYFEQE